MTFASEYLNVQRFQHFSFFNDGSTSINESFAPGFTPFKIYPFRIFQSSFKFFDRYGFVISGNADVELTTTTEDANTPVTAGFIAIEVTV